MEELDARCLEAFPGWLRGLNADSRALGDLVEGARGSEAARRHLVGALNYLFKSLDLIPDGIEDLGFIDDAFVFRVASALAIAEDPGISSSESAIGRMAEDAALIREFLDDDYPRLEAYVRGLGQVSARGRSVDQVIADDSQRAELAREVRSWADAYDAPSFNRDEKTLVKLRAFLSAKLP